MSRASRAPSPADPTTRLDRRQALKLLAGAGVVTVAAACGSSGSSGSGSSSSSAATSSSSPTSSRQTTTAATGSEPIPEETAGPFPGDGSNGPNVLTQDGVVRTDIRSSFGDAAGVAEGVPIDLTLTVLDRATGDAMAGAAVYVWHCDREGRYSMYADAEDANYLRGVQETDANGAVTFTSIFPGAYPGRWPHIHFEVYPSLSEATSAGTPITTTQLAFPASICDTVYAGDGYEASATNMQRTSLEDDMVFADGVDAQLATVAGTVDGGLTARLSVPV
jgi:protocatechuate 3,4-dioxygenase beta subunit